MKRMWIGVGLLAVLLAAGMLTGTLLEKWVNRDVQRLEQAGAAAQNEAWIEAETLTKQVREDWRRRKWVAEMFTDHEKLGEIDTAFAQLKVYRHTDAAAYSAACTAIAQDLQSIAKNQTISWRNFF